MSRKREPKLGNLDQLDQPHAPAPDDGLPQIKVEPAYRRGAPGVKSPYKKPNWFLIA